MKTIAFIFARGGSKGVPGKNIRPLGGKPLLAYSIEIARSCVQIDDVFVSTEDRKIKDTALEWGARVIDRPAELAQDNSPEWLAWRHAVKWVQENVTPFDVFISLPATSPLRDQSDVELCLKQLDEKTDIVVTITDSDRSPWFNMVRVLDDGQVKLLIEGAQRYTRRQDTPEAFDMTTVAYVTRPEFILKENNIFSGRVRAVKIPKNRALDIDTELDFQFAEFLIEKKTGNLLKQ